MPAEPGGLLKGQCQRSGTWSCPSTVLSTSRRQSGRATAQPGDQRGHQWCEPLASGLPGAGDSGWDSVTPSRRAAVINPMSQKGETGPQTRLTCLRTYSL